MAFGVDERQQHLGKAVFQLGDLAIFEQRGNDRMTAGELLQLRGIRGVTGFNLASFWQSQLFEENALKLQVGIYVELLARVLLNRALQRRYPLPEVSVQLLEIVAIDENPFVLHACEHLNQRKLQSARKLPDALSTELLLNNWSDGADRDRFPANAL